MKTLNIKVTPNSKKSSISRENNELKIHLTAPAVEGKANKALIEFLANHFKTKKSKIRIIKGEKSRNKVIQISS